MDTSTPLKPTLAGPKMLLEGPSGTGKTFSLGTLVDWAAKQSPVLPVHVVFTENGLETLLGYWADKGLAVPTNLRYHVCRTPVLDLAALTDAADKAGKLSYASLLLAVDSNRATNNPWLKFLTVLSDVPDDRTGLKHGNIGTWGNDQILVNDSLSETASACFKMVTGNKPVASQPDYQVAQNNLINWLRYMTQSLQCTFVMTAHVQRQTNELTQSTMTMTKAIGKAIGDEIPQLFSETIFTVREGASWTWDTAAFGVDTKTRYLPVQSKITPNFALIMDKWLARAKQ